MSDKGEFTAVVVANKKMREPFGRLRLEFSLAGARAFANFAPGQFAQLDLSNIALPSPENIPQSLCDAAGRKILLRRPFSFAEIVAETDRTFAELLYCVVGPATVRMTALRSGDPVSVIGPLGNGYHVGEGKKKVLLVGGGMGTAPLQHLAQVLTAQHGNVGVVAFAGAKTTDALPFKGRLDDISQQLGFVLPEFAQYGIESLVATDDGSAGYHGLVTECLGQWLKQDQSRADEMIICACGPEPMLAAVARIAAEKNIDCQVSLERRMACGIGLCQSCAVECKVDGSSETVYKMCCEHGPVFDGKEVVF
ncbi:MAG: dihydroorotate dehydrogenase electron transfer subunit [Phycisphaerae bacterium]|nr:dihydroorotate dehydrogenase electron transfer subunit [Phycisphaerae bacterium]